MEETHSDNSSTSGFAWRIPGRDTRTPVDAGGAAKSEHWLDQAIGKFRSGDRVLNRFVIRKRIGQGGMSLVFQAWDENRREEVALKFLSPALLLEPEARERFLNEARISMRLQHPAILRVFEVHEDQGVHFLSMALLSGENLRQRLIRWKREGYQPKPAEVLSVLISVSNALEYAHQYTVHRDVKPENIGFDGTGRAQLMDFGLAEVLRPEDSQVQRHTLSYLRVGTPYYMAPEQLKLSRAGDTRADQFSLAVVAYEMFTGDVPFGLSRSLSDRLPPRYAVLGAVIDRALATDPEDRFANIAEFRRGLEREADGRFDVRAWSRYYARPLGWLAAVVLVLLVFGGMSIGADWVDRRLKEEQENFSRARAARGETDRRATELAARLLEYRKEYEWLTREYSLESAMYERGLTNNTQWAKVISLSNHLAEASFVWRQLEPEVTREGLPITVAESRDDWAEETKELDAAAQLGAAETIAVEIQRSRDRILALEADWRKAYHQDRLQSQRDWLVSTPGAHQEWVRETRVASVEGDVADRSQDFRERLIETTRQQRESTRAALQEWEALFGTAGAPDLSFLADPRGRMERSVVWEREGNLARALVELSEAEKTLRSWLDEVRAGNERAAAVWNASEDGIETEFGMRFVHVKGRDYFSLWETRVMDFARFLTEFPERRLVCGDFWQDPGYPQGPTYPVVGVDRATAEHFAVWVSYQLRYRYASQGRLPNLQDWEELLVEDRGGDDLKIGLYPNRSEWDSEHFASYYSDPGIDPTQYVGPVGRGKPGPFGLFDLGGSVWEWCDDLYRFSNFTRRGPERDTWMLRGGHPMQQTSYQVFEVPDPKYVWVLPKYSIGFRTVLTTRPR